MESKLGRDFLVRLKQIAGQNVAQFSREIGISQQLLNYYVKGERSPGFDFFIKLAYAGYDLHWLITGKVREKERLVRDSPAIYESSWLHQKSTEIARKLAGLRPEDVNEIIAVVDAMVAEKRKKRRKAEAG